MKNVSVSGVIFGLLSFFIVAIIY